MKQGLIKISKRPLVGAVLQLSLLAFQIPARPVEEAPNVSYCELLTSPQTHDGKSVRTTAIIRSNEHDTMVYDVNCGSTSNENKSADMEFPSDWTVSKLGKKLSSILRHHASARVTFVAKFSESAGPYGMLGVRYRFTLIRLIAVEKLPRAKN